MGMRISLSKTTHPERQFITAARRIRWAIQGYRCSSVNAAIVEEYPKGRHDTERGHKAMCDVVYCVHVGVRF